jgi:prepilin peptidase CpaA
MHGWDAFSAAASANGHVWLVTAILVVAAVIDGVQLRVPNWLTFPFIISGWVFTSVSYHLTGQSWLEGLGWSLLGTVTGLVLLLPAYAIGGMGAGDVKLLMGVGAWMHSTDTFYGFCVSAVVGGVLALGMVFARKSFGKHHRQFWLILNEIFTLRDPSQLAAIAAERKSRMYLLPYGIPLAIGTIGYFAWMGMLL